MARHAQRRLSSSSSPSSANSDGGARTAPRAEAALVARTECPAPRDAERARCRAERAPRSAERAPRSAEPAPRSAEPAPRGAEPAPCRVAAETVLPSKAEGASTTTDSGLLAASATTEGVRWRLLLCGATPREVLARIVRDDPLRLRARIGARLLERCLLLDADRVLLRALARIARAAGRYQGRPDLGKWLDGHIDQALEDCRVSNTEAAGRLQPAGGAFHELARPLRLDAARLAVACARFNERDDEARRAFFQLVLRRPSTTHTQPAVLGMAELEALRRALEPFLALSAAPVVESAPKSASGSKSVSGSKLVSGSKREVSRGR